MKEYFKNIIYFTYKNRDLIKKIMTSKYSIYIENLLIEAKMEEMNYIFEINDKDVDEEHLKFYSEIFACAYGNFSYRHCDKDCNDVEKMADMLVDMFKNIK